jgi:hypothetical protein
MFGVAKSQQSVQTIFVSTPKPLFKVVSELKATELDFPSSVPKTGLYREGIQAG